MTCNEVQSILDNIKYKDWTFYLGDDNGRMYLQIHFLEKDFSKGTSKLTLQTGRKWMLSQHMVTSEIVRTAHKAIRTAVEYEVDEQFLYKGVPIYNPHTNVEALVEASESIEIRETVPVD